MSHNEKFVSSESYRKYEINSALPLKSCVILSCMDSRLTHLLPAAMNIKQGEAKMIKTAGAFLSHPFGGIMRSIIVAVYELNAKEVFVVGHDDCGMSSVNSERTKQKMLAAGIPQDRLSVLENSGIDIIKWLKGFDSLDDSVLTSVHRIKSHPLMPPSLQVSGLIMHPSTGALRFPVGRTE